MQKISSLKYFLIIVILFAAVAIIYYSWVVYTAREYTISNVLPNLSMGHYTIKPSDLSSKQLEILLKVEDPLFLKHGGVDFSTPGAGITTITQGLAKHLYFKKFKPGIAKVKQTLIAAFVLDPLMSKNDQLLLFVNTVYLGKGVHGFEQAAKVYFNKSFKELTEDEYTAIIAMIIAPSVFNIKEHPTHNAERVARIKRVVTEEYKPIGLFDVYYGKIDPDVQKDLPMFSYFSFYYQ